MLILGHCCHLSYSLLKTMSHSRKRQQNDNNNNNNGYSRWVQAKAWFGLGLRLAIFWRVLGQLRLGFEYSEGPNF